MNTKLNVEWFEMKSLSFTMGWLLWEIGGIFHILSKEDGCLWSRRGWSMQFWLTLDDAPKKGDQSCTTPGGVTDIAVCANSASWTW